MSDGREEYVALIKRAFAAGAADERERIRTEIEALTVFAEVSDDFLRRAAVLAVVDRITEEDK